MSDQYAIKIDGTTVGYADGVDKAQRLASVFASDLADPKRVTYEAVETTREVGGSGVYERVRVDIG
jgi:hypothetical protein